MARRLLKGARRVSRIVHLKIAYLTIRTAKEMTTSSHKTVTVRLAAILAGGIAAVCQTDAAPYASGISFSSPTTVNFTLSEPADLLSVSINGGPAFTLDGSTSGLKTFNLGSASDKFSITAVKT